MDDESAPEGLPIRVDEEAESASPDVPGFLARPEGAPVYHGFPLLEIEIDGFRLGAITDFVGAEVGDGFVVAPDGSRAGLVWQIAADVDMFSEAMAPDNHRWGVWEVSFPAVMKNDDVVRANFASILPRLKERWEAWRHQQGDG